MWAVFHPKYILGCECQKGMIHRLSTALKNTWSILIQHNKYMVISHIFVTAAVATINKTDFRITMSPYLKGENNIRFWSKCLSWIYVWWNLPKIEQWFEQHKPDNSAYILFNRFGQECRFIMVQWIYIMEVYIYIFK